MASEDTAFEFAIGIFSVLTGLAIADVATSFHRLMRNRTTVRWDALTLSAATYALCTTVCMWFDLWGVRHFAMTRQLLFYLALVGLFFILFLAAAASLPDEAGPHTDLRAYYEGNRLYFWILIGLFQLGYVLFGLYFLGLHDPHPALYGLMIAPTLICVALIVFPARIAQWIGLSLLFVMLLLHYGAARIA